MARQRLPAAEARARILDTARSHLMARGPAAMTLKDLADELGVTRQAILHHFGSREGVLRAVVERAWSGLFADLAGLAGASRELDPAAFLELVDDVARQKGNARLGAWLLLSEQGLPEGFFAGALEALPTQLDPNREAQEARYALLLIGAALFGDAIFGTRLRQALGLSDGEDERAAFRAWLAARLA